VSCTDSQSFAYIFCREESHQFSYQANFQVCATEARVLWVSWQDPMQLLAVQSRSQFQGDKRNYLMSCKWISWCWISGKGIRSTNK